MPTINLSTQQLEQLDGCAQQILTQTQPKRKFLLFGQMGAGKTTLIKAFCRQLGVVDASHSPTYTLVNTYQNAQGEQIHHLDLYRIQRIDEATYADLESYLFEDGYAFIEWADILENFELSGFVKLYISADAEEKRSIRVEF